MSSLTGTSTDNRLIFSDIKPTEIVQADQLAGVRENLNTLVQECILHLGNPHQVRYFRFHYFVAVPMIVV